MNKKTKNIAICALIGLVIGVFIIIYNAYKDSECFLILKKLELKSYDVRLSYKYSKKKTFKEPKVIVYVIDEASKQFYPDLFEGNTLKRDVLASIIDKLNNLEAKTIVLDFLFTRNTEPEAPENKKLLATILKYQNIILASYINYRTATEGNSITTSFNDYFPDNYYGLVNIERDIDEFIRRFKYSMPYTGFDFSSMQEKEKFAPTLAVSAINNYKPGFINNSLINSKSHQNNYINFTRSGEVRYFRPIYTLFSKNADEINKSINFKNKIVLIGNALVSSHDFYEVPIITSSCKKARFIKKEHSMPGVEIHANIIDTILNNEVIKDLDFKTNSIVIIFLCTLLGGLLGLNRGIIYSISLPVVIIMLYIIFAFRLFEYDNLVVYFTTPLFQFILVTSFCWVFLYFRENKTRIYIYNSFKKYVSPEVAKIASNKIEQLSAQRKRITLLFSDIAGFTTISEQTDPVELSKLLNKYFTKMGQIIFKNEGTLDKYIGDAVMAFWGAPLDVAEQEYKACAAALEMQNVIKELNEEFNKQNFPPFNVRIGINTAEVMVGNLGGDLFNYTAIGDGVNLASRLEGVNKKFNTSIIISEYTYEKIKNRLICRKLGKIIVKGKAESVTIYELLGFQHNDPKDNKKLSMLFAQGLSSFKSKNWQEAEEIFKQVLTLKANDGASQLYLKEIQYYKNNPPGKDWDGVIELKEK